MGHRARRPSQRPWSSDWSTRWPAVRVRPTTSPRRPAPTRHDAPAPARSRHRRRARRATTGCSRSPTSAGCFGHAPASLRTRRWCRRTRRCGRRGDTWPHLAHRGDGLLGPAREGRVGAPGRAPRAQRQLRRPDDLASSMSWAPSPRRTTSRTRSTSSTSAAARVRCWPPCCGSTRTLSGTLFDQPHVVAASAARDLADRWSAVGGSFFEPVPAADCYLMKWILHDWSDEECVRSCAGAARRCDPAASCSSSSCCSTAPATSASPP